MIDKCGNKDGENGNCRLIWTVEFLCGGGVLIYFCVVYL